MIQYLLLILIGYLLGASHMSFYISKIKNVDIKSTGSKNYGTCNTFIVAGKWAGVLVFIHDVLKSVIAVLIAKFFFANTPNAEIVAGVSAIVGHIFPFYLKFDGGKGFASLIGVIVTISPLYGTLLLIFAFVFALIIDYIVAATFTCACAAPMLFGLLHGWQFAAIALIASILIIYKHKQNMINLFTHNGQETKFRTTLFKKKEKHK